MFWAGLSLVLLTVIAAFAWSMRDPPRAIDRRVEWKRTAAHLGLILRTEVPNRYAIAADAEGRFRGFPMRLYWSDDSHARLVLEGTSLVSPQRCKATISALAAHVALGTETLPGSDHHWRSTDPKGIDRLACLAVQRMLRDRTSRLEFELDVLPGCELAAAVDAASLAVWIATSFGWEPSWDDALDSTPDPMTSLLAWEKRLGGWVPTGSVEGSAAHQRRDAARAASESLDPSIAALGALHLGPEGLPRLLRTLRDPATPDDLLVKILSGVSDALAQEDWIALLPRHDHLCEAAAHALAIDGDWRALAALREITDRRGAAGRAVMAATAAIRKRGDGRAGDLSLATDRLHGRLSELHARAGDLGLPKGRT